MKTKIFRIGKRTISVVLSLMMIVSIILVGMVYVNAVGAVNYVMKSGDILYYDLNNVKDYDVNYLKMDNSKQTTYISKSNIPSDGILKIDVTADCNFNEYKNSNTVLFKSSKNWNVEVRCDKLPSNGQNMIIISADGESYTWGTYSGSTIPDDPVDPTYYIGGRFKVRESDSETTHQTKTDGSGWLGDCTDSYFKFTESDTTGLYYLNTYSTIAELSAQINNYDPYFLIHTGNGDAGTWYGGSSSNLHNIEEYSSASNPATLTTHTGANSVDKLMLFNGASTTGDVTLWLDTNDGMKLYIETDGSDIPDDPTETTKIKHIKNTNALWLDANPSESATETTATLIKWNNESGGGSGTHGSYYFYVPANVDLTQAVVYNGFSSAVTFGSTSISANSCATVSLTTGTTYSTGQGNVIVMKGSTDAMFIEQSNGNLPTNTDNNLDSKGDVNIKGGTIITMDNDSTTAVFSDSLAVESIKGRGNSSWKASYQIFGKYAFNMKLEDGINLFGMDSAENTKGSKSWCLLANNADESMLRNALTYDLANELGLPYAPEFRFVDIYDNNRYLGSYLITEKVDVGSKKLIKGEAFDDINEELVEAYNKANNLEGTDNEVSINEDAKVQTGTPGNAGSYQYNNIYDGTPVVGEPVYNTRGTYLLEFEINERCDKEASWFVSSEGQNVVVKSPEFATQAQVQFVQQKFNAMEEAIFDGADVETLSQYMDVDSFVKMYLIQELSANLDSAATSFYIMLDCSNGAENARFVASPVWDYDWAYGQYKYRDQYNAKYAVDGTVLHPEDPEKWLAKIKSRDDSSSSQIGYYSIQSKLADTNDSFKSYVKHIWNTSFYPTIQEYYKDNGQIDQWYAETSASIAMNENRWGFIKSDSIVSWGSNDTGDIHFDAVDYLKNDWTKTRAIWLNTQIQNYDDYETTELATPTIKAYDSDGTTELTGAVEAGETYIIKATTTDSDVTYVLYNGDTQVATNTTGVFEITAVAGTYNYTVKTTKDTLTSEASSVVEVTVNASTIPELTDVALESSTTTVALNGTFELTATATPSNVDCTYVFYKSTDNSVSDDDTVLISSGNKATVTADTEGTFYYYVVATDSNDSSKKFTSELISVQAVASGETLESVTIKLKGTSLASLAPSVSVDGADKAQMKKSTDGYIGTHYSGSYQFYWFETTLNNVNVGETYTLTFTTANSDMNASVDVIFLSTDTVRYFAVDNMQTGTKAEDITDNDTMKTFFRSSVNMISNITESDDPLYIRTSQAAFLTFKTLAGKAVTKKCYLGDVDTDNSLSVNDVTAIQFYLVGSSDLDDNNSILCDYNMDGVVDVNDATAIQLRLAGIH